MGSHVVEVLRQGLWASLTGGWFYDPHLTLFSNTCHLYLWIVLFVTPFVIQLTVPKSVSVLAWVLYCIVIGITFIVIKVVNYKLHKLFDTNEKIEAPNDGNTNWMRAQSGSPASLEQIEMRDLGNNSSSRDVPASPTDNAAAQQPKNNVTVVDIERGAGEEMGAAGGNGAVGVTSLEDITSMEDIVSLEDLQLEDQRSGCTLNNSGSDSVRNFRKTVKAMSTQVTPQTSPLVGYRRRAISQERWPTAVLSGTTPPPTLKRQQAHYHSQRVTRRRNISYRRRSKSVLDSPHGSHMLIGESRTDERPPLTLEWAGHPHPSPRPRHRNRHRQMSLEEPLPGSAARRYSLDLKPRRGRSKDRIGIGTQSSNVLLRTDSEKSEDLKALRDNLLSGGLTRKISTVSEPCDPFGERSSSDDSCKFAAHPALTAAGKNFQTSAAKHTPTDAGEDIATAAGKGTLEEVTESLPTAVETTNTAAEIVKSASADALSDEGGETTTDTDEMCVEQSSKAPSGYPSLANRKKHKEMELPPIPNKSRGRDGASDKDRLAAAITEATKTDRHPSPVLLRDGANETNNNNDDESDCAQPTSDRTSSLLLTHYECSEPSEPLTGLSVVQEITELETPRSPPVVLSCVEGSILSSANINGEENGAGSSSAADGGAIPKTSSRHHKRSHYNSDDDGMTTVTREEQHPSPSSSVSGSENTALLVTAKSSIESNNSSHQLNDGSAVELKPRHTVRRSTTTGADHRSSARRARYYDSQSSWGSRRSSRSRRHSDSDRPSAQSNVFPPAEQPPAEQWHFFKDTDGCWYKYTFDSTSDGQPENLGRDFVPPDGHDQQDTETPSRHPRPLYAEDDFGIHDFHPDIYRYLQPRNTGGVLDFYDSIRARLQASRMNARRDSDGDSSDTTTQTDRIVPSPPEPNRPKQFYKWKISSRLPSIKIWLDRLSLLALLDRNVPKESVASVLLSILVSILASVQLGSGYYQDIYTLLFCFVVAGCQYSLLKSVQPDAASPTHGYNNVIVYSRAFYFCIISILIILLDTSVSRFTGYSFSLYGMDLISTYLLIYARNLLKVLMLCLPLIFTFGLLPQVNTFTQYLLEQIEIHIFGGNGTTSLFASLYTVVHSLVAVLILYGMAFVPIQLTGKDIDKVKEIPKNVTFSVFVGLLVSLSYHYSRMSSDPTHLWMLIKSACGRKNASADEESADGSIQDPLPSQIRTSMYQRLRNDLIVCTAVAIFVFGIHVSTVFVGNLQPALHDSLSYITIAVGFLTHYLMGQLRKEYPWLCCSHPILKTPERSLFNITGPATITWFERLYVWVRFVEKNLLYPAVFISGISISTPPILDKFGLFVGPLVLAVCGLKCLRSMFSDTSSHYCVLALTQFAFNYDYNKSPEKDMFILNYALMLIFYSKLVDFYLKCKFIFVYIAPWQLAWGSAFHAFAQPLSVPHSCMLFAQAAISALLYTPLNPLLGSAIFINSYMRPVKFWERDYNTKRADHSNIRLASQVDNSLGSDDNNLNSIFYEHLTRSLQKMLCGDLMMGRWGEAHQGDMFIMASDYLNALVHIIEMGNGLVTFQLRGLEFRGTYCQQREVEAITEGVDDDIGLCCCNPGHLPHFLSVNAAFGERWLAWEVTVTMYILDGYSITDNNAASMLQVYDLRKVLITYYVKSVIFYTIRSPKLLEWLTPDGVTANIDTNEDMASVFSIELDEDYDRISHKVTEKQFSRVYLAWIRHCIFTRSDVSAGDFAESRLVRLCYALSLVARRALATAAHNNCNSVNVEFFLHGLHSLFKGDFRITGTDEWIFKDMEFLRKVISPAVRMALKLHQDHFSVPDDEFTGHDVLYDTMMEHDEGLVITHEADPDWRNAVLTNRPSLLALRHVFDEGSNVYKIIMLNKRHLSFRIIKVNRECVRGLWAGQQQELVFLRNRNPERGSIQNAKQALRNMINSSCDQPIGYPIYVSPLTTSYAATNDQFSSVLFGELSLCRLKRVLTSAWQRIRLHCGQRCRNFGSTSSQDLPTVVLTAVTGNADPTTRDSSRRAADIRLSSRQPSSRHSTTSRPSTSSLPLRNLHTPGSYKHERALPGASNNPLQKETSFSEASKDVNAGLTVNTEVIILDPMCVIGNMNKGKPSDPAWPSVEMQKSGGVNGWGGLTPMTGTTGKIVHKWIPDHSDIKYRSTTTKTIYLVKVAQNYIPITEQGIASIE